MHAKNTRIATGAALLGCPTSRHAWGGRRDNALHSLPAYDQCNAGRIFFHGHKFWSVDHRGRNELCWTEACRTSEAALGSRPITEPRSQHGRSRRTGPCDASWLLQTLFTGEMLEVSQRSAAAARLLSIPLWPHRRECRLADRHTWKCETKFQGAQHDELSIRPHPRMLNLLS